VFRSLGAIILYEWDRFGGILTAFLHSAALPVCAGNLRRPGDKPIVALLDHGCEFIVGAGSIESKSIFKLDSSLLRAANVQNNE
jgi:hypothetical protein